MTVDNVGKSDSPGATHAPHHAPKDWIAKFKGKFDHGWDKQREITFENQKKMGLIPPHSVLTARPNDLPAWDNSTAEDKKLYARMMEVRQEQNHDRQILWMAYYGRPSISFVRYGRCMLASWPTPTMRLVV